MPGQVDFTPKRTIQGALQELSLDGAQANVGDQVLWTSDALCPAATVDLGGLPTPTMTKAYTVTSATSFASALHASAVPGSWRLCYNSALRSAVSGTTVFQPIAHRDLAIITFPSATPLIGIASGVTPITFSGSSGNGDTVVLQEFSCYKAHQATATVNSTRAALSANRISTLSGMTHPATLKICFATLESGEWPPPGPSPATLSDLGPRLRAF